MSKGRRGQAAARQALTEIADNPWSVPERELQNLFRREEVTGRRSNAAVTVRSGRRFYSDFVFDDIKLLVEIDGRAVHSTREAFDSDRARQNELVEAGWTVLRFTASQVADDPRSVVATVRRMVSRLSTVDGG